MRRLAVLPAALLVLAVLGGCSGGRGMMITDDGRVVQATPEAYRAEAERALVAAAAAFVPEGAAIEARIAQLPRWGTARRDPAERWRWERLDATVTVRGAEPTDRAALVAEARRAVAARADRRDRVQVELVVVDAPTAPAAPAAEAPPAERRERADGPRTYTARAGDTLADLSLAFYGTDQHWRVIKDANPGIDFAAIRGGEVVLIPRRP